MFLYNRQKEQQRHHTKVPKSVAHRLIWRQGHKMFYNSPPTCRPTGGITNKYTCNVTLRRALLSNHSFGTFGKSTTPIFRETNTGTNCYFRFTSPHKKDQSRMYVVTLFFRPPSMLTGLEAQLRQTNILQHDVL